MKNLYFAYRSFWPEPEAHRRFNDIGVDTVCFFAANTVNSLGEPYCKYPPSWVFKQYSPEGQYDFEPVDAQMADLMRDSPDAKFICMVDLNTPQWLSAFILACDSFSQLGRLCSDPEWRRVTADYMRNFLEHMEKHYPDKIAAYVLAGGNTSEWYDYSKLAESPSRSAAWARELEAKGLPAKDVPGLRAREHVSFDGLLRDPRVDGEALDYIRFCAGQITDTIKFFLRKARESIRPGIELGVFHGYPLCLGGERVILGNNDCRELLRCPELDFVITPNCGAVFSAMGKGGGDLGPTESVQLHGKRYLRECDQKTHTYNNKLSKHVSGDWGLWKTEAETLAGLKRELAYTLIKRCSCWWFDMWGGFYDPPPVMELLAQGRKLFQEHINTPVEPVAETVLVVDPDSIHYLNQHDYARTQWFYMGVKAALDLLGAPYECYHFDDIPDIPDKGRVKLWLLPGLFEVTPEKQRVLDQHVRRPGRTAVYLYAPGISDGKSLDPARVKRLSGSAFGTPGVSAVDLDGHRSVYAATGPDLTPAALKAVAREAGVHLYSEREQPVYANSRFLAVHTAAGGVQRIRLPRRSSEVWELFTGRVVARDCQEFEHEFKSPDTALFSHGPATSRAGSRP